MNVVGVGSVDLRQGNEAPFLSLRVFIDRYVRDDEAEGGIRELDGDFVSVTYNGDDAEHLSTLIQKGMRVRFQGSAAPNEYESDGTLIKSWEYRAQWLAADLNARIEHIGVRERTAQAANG